MNNNDGIAETDMTNPQAGPGQQAGTRVAQRLVAGLLVALLPGCGGGGGRVTAPPAPAPPAPVTTVVEEGVIALGPNRVTWGNIQ